MRPYDGLQRELRLLRAALAGSGYLWSRAAARNLQDPLSLPRRSSQVQGATRDALAFAPASWRSS